jgi:hypothetical protein
MFQYFHDLLFVGKNIFYVVHQKVIDDDGGIVHYWNLDLFNFVQ